MSPSGDASELSMPTVKRQEPVVLACSMASANLQFVSCIDGREGER